MATPLHEDAGELQVTLPTGGAIELHEGHLDLRVPAHELPPAWTELTPDAVDEPFGDAQEPIVAETSLPGDGRLDEVAGHVQLVAPLHVA